MSFFRLVGIDISVSCVTLSVMRDLNKIFKGYTVSEKLQTVLSGDWNPDENVQHDHFLKSDKSSLNYLKIKKANKPLSAIYQEYKVLREKLGNIIPRSVFFESPNQDDPLNPLVVCLTGTLNILHDLGSILYFMACYIPEESILPDSLEKVLKENPYLETSIDHFFETLSELANERTFLDLSGAENLSLVKDHKNEIQLKYLDNSDGYFQVSENISLQDNGGYKRLQTMKTGWQNTLLALKKDKSKIPTKT